MRDVVTKYRYLPLAGHTPRISPVFGKVFGGASAVMFNNSSGDGLLPDGIKPPPGQCWRVVDEKDGGICVCVVWCGVVVG